MEEIKKHRTKRSTPWAERFWAKVTKDCDHWIWTGPTTKSGTPRFSISARASAISCYQLSWKLSGASIAHGKIQNTCGNQRCIRPECLAYIYKTETKEMKTDVVERWRLHLAHGTTLQEIGDRHGISRERVRQIVAAAGLPGVRTKPAPRRLRKYWGGEDRGEFRKKRS